MGGALALLTALHLRRQRLPVAGLYTFGQPKTGARGFSDYVNANLDQPYFRFVHGADAFAAWGFGRRALLASPAISTCAGVWASGGSSSSYRIVGLRFHAWNTTATFCGLISCGCSRWDEDADVTLIER